MQERERAKNVQIYLSNQQIILGVSTQTICAKKMCAKNMQSMPTRRPTAAAIAYGLDRNNHGEEYVLIFDLGGDALHLTMLLLEDGIFEVYGTHTVPAVGGDHWDDALVSYLAQVWKKKQPSPSAELTPRSLARLKQVRDGACAWPCGWVRATEWT